MNVYDFLLLINHSQHVAILLYAGPDQILPLVSILGTIIGFLLILWRRLFGMIGRASRSFSRKPRPLTKPESSPSQGGAVTLEPYAKEEMQPVQD